MPYSPYGYVPRPDDDAQFEAETHPFPPEAQARFRAYIETCEERRRRARAIITALTELDEEQRQAHIELFRHLKAEVIRSARDFRVAELEDGALVYQFAKADDDSGPRPPEWAVGMLRDFATAQDDDKTH